MKPPLCYDKWNLTHSFNITWEKEGEREEDWDKDGVLSSGGSYGHF